MTLLLAISALTVSIPLTAGLWALRFSIVPLDWFQTFAWSAAIGGAMGAFIFMKLPIIAILEHEFTHVCAALCLFRKPLRIVVSSHGGETVYEGRGSVLIRLAPYVLPSTTLIGLVVVLIFSIDPSMEWVASLSSLWGYHLVTGFWNQPRGSQTYGGVVSSLPMEP